jgi:coenzyme F420-0:L-glutamate ligase / coenzyme F420-1:gamma-L-glutamate ligase
VAFFRVKRHHNGILLTPIHAVEGGMESARQSRSLLLIAMAGFPIVEPGTDLGHVICGLARTNGPEFLDQDVVVVAQKVVSKAEGRYVDLANVRPGSDALALAEKVQKDPRLVEVILAESRRVIRHRPGVLIVEHRLGFVTANAGVDQSNVDPTKGTEPVLLLPNDPDASAQRMHEQLRREFGKAIGVVISDSFGRAWRIGTVGVALGAAGVPSVRNLRGRPDIHGRRLRVSETGFADEIAAAASLLMGQADEGTPVVILRGLAWSEPSLPAAALTRRPEEDLFR